MVKVDLEVESVGSGNVAVLAWSGGDGFNTEGVLGGGAWWEAEGGSGVSRDTIIVDAPWRGAGVSGVGFTVLNDVVSDEWGVRVGW